MKIRLISLFLFAFFLLPACGESGPDSTMTQKAAIVGEEEVLLDDSYYFGLPPEMATCERDEDCGSSDLECVLGDPCQAPDAAANCDEEIIGYCLPRRPPGCDEDADCDEGFICECFVYICPEGVEPLKHGFDDCECGQEQAGFCVPIE